MTFNFHYCSNFLYTFNKIHLLAHKFFIFLGLKCTDAC